jgi:hypothetical protein
MTKNPISVAGGKATSEKKTKANREKMRKFWHEVKTGKRPAPKNGRPSTSPRKQLTRKKI